MIDIDLGTHKSNTVLQHSISRAPYLKKQPQLAATNQTNENDVEVDVKLGDKRDIEIFMKIHFGSHQQPIHMLMDTGSGTTWCLHRFCENCNKKAEKLDERNSSTFSYYPAMYDFHYGIGSTYGYNGFD